MRSTRLIILDTLLKSLDLVFCRRSHSTLWSTLLPGPQSRAFDASEKTLVTRLSLLAFNASKRASIAWVRVSESRCHDESRWKESDDVGIEFAPLAQLTVLPVITLSKRLLIPA